MIEHTESQSIGSKIDPQELADILANISAAQERGNLVDWTLLANEHPQFAKELEQIRPAIEGLGSLRQDDQSDQSGTSSIRDEFVAKQALGDFQLVREIGRGGMGVVFEAQQLSLGRIVAVKVLPLAALIDRKALSRFRNEVQAAASLDHPNIVSIYSVGEDRGVHYYAMQLIRGQSLASIIGTLRHVGLRTGSIPGSSFKLIVNNDAKQEIEPSIDLPSIAQQTMDTRPPGLTNTRHTEFDPSFFQDVANLGVQAADALEHAHVQGIIHRDVKPGNLLLDGEGNLFVTDFGLARIETSPGVTMTGDLLGTLRYMSPEQVLANRIVVDHRTDIYSLGLTLYEMLTLRPAFSGNERPELIRQISLSIRRRHRN